MTRWTGRLLAAALVAGGIFGGVLYGQSHPAPAAAAAGSDPVTQVSSSSAVAYTPGVGMMGATSGFGGMMGGRQPGGTATGGGSFTTSPGAQQAMQGMMQAMGVDPGKMMGAAMASYAPQRVSPDQAAALGNAVPAGATLDQATNQITFTTNSVHFTVLASPDGAPDMTFRIAGLTDPTLVVPKGAQVSVELIQADSGESHGWLLTAAQAPFPYMAMMGAPAAFPGSFAMPLGEPVSAGMAAETITFTAGAPGQYTYLCPVPGHAQKGMHGAFIVTGA